jgi:hypothetical protein
LLQFGSDLQTGEEQILEYQPPSGYFPYWNEEKQSLKQRIFYSEIFTENEAKDIEDKFSKLRDIILREHFKLASPATQDWLKSIIDRYYYKEIPGNENLNQYIQRFIDEISSWKRLVKGKRYTASTIKNYKGFQVQLNEFQGIYTEERLLELKEEGKSPRSIKKLNFDDITIDFYNEFLSFFNDKNYSPHTIGRHIKHLKVIMRQSMEEGLHSNTEFQRRSFEAMAVPVDNVYLNEDELKAMFGLDLSAFPHLEIARDVFLCGCYTVKSGDIGV